MRPTQVGRGMKVMATEDERISKLQARKALGLR